MAGIKCGNCHEFHNTRDEVKACWQARYNTKSEVAVEVKAAPKAKFPDMEYKVEVLGVSVRDASTGNTQIVIEYRTLGTIDLGRYPNRHFWLFRNLQPTAITILVKEFEMVTGSVLPKALLSKTPRQIAAYLRKAMVGKVAIARLYQDGDFIVCRYVRKAADVELLSV